LLILLISLFVIGAAIVLWGIIPSCPSGTIDGFSGTCAARSGTNLYGEALYDLSLSVNKRANGLKIGVGIGVMVLSGAAFVWARAIFTASDKAAR
jgi:hypothetical protein